MSVFDLYDCFSTESITAVINFVLLPTTADGSYLVDFSSNGSSLTTIAGQYQITAKDVTLLSTAVLNTV